MGELHHRLPDGDDLAGLDARCGDHAVNVRLELGILELIAGELERAARTRDAALRFVVRGLLEIELREGCETAILQGGVAVEVGRGLRQARRGGGKFGLGALHLQAEVLRIEPGDDVAGTDAVTNIDQASHHLAADAEREIGFVAGAHDADEFAGGRAIAERDALHLHRPLELGDRGGLGLAAGQEKREAERERAGEDVSRKRGLMRGVITADE